MALTLTGFVPAEAQVAPNPIGSTDCALPQSLKDVTGHLLLRFHVTVDGAVDSVENVYGTVQPPNRKAAVEKALNACVQGLRYERGVATTRYTARHFFTPEPGGGAVVRLDDGRAIPLAWIEKMRREKLAFADHLLRGSHYLAVQGTEWSLRTDANPKIVDNVEKALRFTERAFGTAFPGAAPSRDSTEVAILLFRKERAFNAIAAFDNLVPRRGPVAGLYTRIDRTIYVGIGDQPRPLVVSLLVHETTHHLIYRLYTGGRHPPRWVSEGIASFVECLPVRKKKIDLHKIGRGTVRRGMWEWSRRGEDNLQMLRMWKLPSLRQLDEQDAELSPKLFYAYAWGFVHFLINSADGAYRPGFQAWMQNAKTSGDIESLADALGRDVPTLETELRAYLQEL